MAVGDRVGYQELEPQDICACGHLRKDHVYNEGPCRPGWECMGKCEGFRPMVVKKAGVYFRAGKTGKPLTLTDQLTVGLLKDCLEALGTNPWPGEFGLVDERREKPKLRKRIRATIDELSRRFR